MQVGNATEDNGPDDCTNRTNDVLWDEEQGHKDNGEEGNCQWTGEVVPRHLEAVWQEVAGFSILAVSDHCQGVHDDVHVVG